MPLLTRQRRCNGIWAPVELSYLTTVVSIVLGLITIPGNVLVILAVVKSSHRELRTTFMTLVVCLAIADFQVGVVVEPLSVITHVLESLRQDMTGYQKAEHISYFLSCSVSLFTLAALALDRYSAVSLPVWYRNNVTQRRVMVMVLLIWIFCICLTSLYFEIGFVAFLFVFANTAVFVTILILLFSYILTLRRAKRFGKVSSLSHRYNEGLQKEGNSVRRKRAKREEKITKTFLIMLLFVLVFYFPSCVMMYMINLCTTCSCVFIHWLRDIQFLFIWANSAVNPALYALRLPRFRRAFMSSLGFKRSAIDVEVENKTNTKEYTRTRVNEAWSGSLTTMRTLSNT